MFFLILFIPTILISQTLYNYIEDALVKSNYAYDLKDEIRYKEFDVASAEHTYAAIFSPDSAIGMSDTSSNYRIGFNGRKQNVYGGEVYGAVSVASNNYDTIEDSYNTKLTVGYRQSLFRRFGEEYNDYSLFTTKERLRLNYLFNEESKMDIVIKATTLYYLAVVNREKIAIHLSAMQRSKKNFDAASAKQKSGIVSKIDVYRAKLSFLEQKSNVRESQKRYKDGVEEALFFINVGYQEHYFESGSIIEFNKIFDSAQIDNVLPKRAEWQEMLFQENVLKKELYIANKNLLPDISLNTQYAKTGADPSFSNAWNLNESQWNIGLSTDYSFDTFNQRQTLERLGIKKQRLRRDKSALKRAIFKEIRELENNYVNVVEQLEIEQMKAHESLEGLKVSKMRYERGLASNLDILDAENAYSNAQVAYLESLFNHNITLLRLAKSLSLMDENFLREVIREK